MSRLDVAFVIVGALVVAPILYAVTVILLLL
jgi:hypothetical protein